ncbi:MAG: TetR/AcrR family transcriptional regulator [bacterium]|jgi:AcrR family transcriptional regulator|nr:TetR/AcrR family transcriptional regulator [bacterium]MDD3625334.1 TetR/AcrR family transcriptional regulator [Proteiniphilum sp.]MDD3968735.1 TetR/AcrR family transcriptional regulator [Proteiniphilum sp.]MDD4458932.1 TetR/AcrR family transcriptional regulator [Proteiniphilum sp.]
MEPITTEEKIIRAADKIFTQKGYAATRTREIAEEAGTNLALLNYYFGSKEKLFRNVVREKLKMLLSAMGPIASDASIPIEEKIRKISENYTQLLLENEELPLFILNEWSVNKRLFADLIRETRQHAEPVIEKQLRESGMQITLEDLIVNTLGMILFPFIAKPLILSSGLVQEDQFTAFVAGRKEKIPAWIISLTKQTVASV